MDRPSQTYLMATDTASGPSQAALLPPWLSNSGNAPSARSPSPSVTLSLASAVAGVSPPIPWTQSQREVAELAEWCREVEEGHRAWAAHKKEAGWRLRRVEAQLEAERAGRRREKAAEVDAKVRALREEQQAALERIEAEYREQLAGLRRDAEAKEQKLAELWAAKHARLASFLEQMGCPPPPNAR